MSTPASDLATFKIFGSPKDIIESEKNVKLPLNDHNSTGFY